MSADLQIAPPRGGYRDLVAFRKSDVIDRGTVVFCRRFLPARAAARAEDWNKAVYSRLGAAADAAELETRAAEIKRQLERSIYAIRTFTQSGKERAGYEQQAKK